VNDAPVVIELNPRERRLYDRVRARLVAPGRRRTSRTGDVLLLLPDLVVLLARLLRDERVPLRAKALALLGLGYALSPIDLLPEILLGPVGLADDLLVVGAALGRLIGDVHPDVVRSHWSGQGDALEAIRRVTAWSNDLVSGRFRAALRRLFG
jgi:uncharacterized membrane protein YkvA (DUF1232 family)